MPGSVLVSGARTPVGKLLGSLASFQAVDLGGIAIEAALGRAGVSGDQVDYVIMGQVLQAGAGQITARQAAVKGGIPMTVPALTINKVCLSGLDAIALADQLIAAGEYDVVVAGGMESMTNAPHLLTGARKGYKYGNGTLLDSMAHDGLFCAFDQVAMGESTERYNAKLGITRDEQDAFAARPHERAVLAEIGHHGVVAGPDASLQAQPANAITKALGRSGASVDALDLIEINEAFASVAIHSTRMLGIDPDKVNVNGGAIALGHPIGASGARLAIALAYELKRRGGGLGAAALCGGGGQGDALLLRVPS